MHEKSGNLFRMSEYTKSQSRAQEHSVIWKPEERSRRYRPGKKEVRVNPDLGSRPPWMRVKTPNHGKLKELEHIVETKKLHTVCESANCPNRGECWSAGTATIMILGNICTRSCGFCSVKTGRPTEYDRLEPERVVEMVQWMKLRYVVITSVDRDDLKDGGSEVWADTITRVRAACPELGIEVLVPDFQGQFDNQKRVFDARPHVFAHNLETIERLHPTVRPQATYQRSLEILQRAKREGLVTKSSLMLGLGEQQSETKQAIQDLADRGCDVLCLGQYLQPTRSHLPIERWVHPDEFAELQAFALEKGFSKCDSGPLVRSSYHAEGVLSPDLELSEVIAKAIQQKPDE